MIVRLELPGGSYLWVNTLRIETISTEDVRDISTSVHEYLKSPAVVVLVGGERIYTATPVRDLLSRLNVL